MADEGADAAPRRPARHSREAGRRAVWRGLVQLGHHTGGDGRLASPLWGVARTTGVETDRAGPVPAEPDCTLPGRPEVFAIGDMVALNKVPGIAQSARQEGTYVGKVIEARKTAET